MRLERIRMTAIYLLAAFLAFAVPSGIAGCLGQQTRATVGVATLDLAREGLVEDARIGADTYEEPNRTEAHDAITAFEAAIATKERPVIAAEAYPRWPVVRSAIEAGVAARLEAGSIGPTGAGSLLERAARFDELIAKVSGPAP